jgi:hypothetical protein
LKQSDKLVSAVNEQQGHSGVQYLKGRIRKIHVMLQHIFAAAVYILLYEQQTDCFSLVVEPVQAIEVA